MKKKQVIITPIDSFKKIIKKLNRLYCSTFKGLIYDMLFFQIDYDGHAKEKKLTFLFEFIRENVLFLLEIVRPLIEKTNFRIRFKEGFSSSPEDILQ